MKIGIAGVRGSIPTPTGNTLFERRVETSKYGGNTTCVYVEADDGSQHILDAGTGIRDLGVYLASQGGFNGQGRELNLYITHTHWDHIQGIPFFGPAYVPGNKITVFGEAKVRGVHDGVKLSLEAAIREHSDQPGYFPGLLCVEGEGLQKVLQNQQSFRNFPAPLEALRGVQQYNDFIAGMKIYEKGNLSIDTLALNHPGNSIAYRLTEKKNDGSKKMMVFSTDFEPDENGFDEKVIEFWRGANLVVADAQYEPRGSPYTENKFMPTWGHSDYYTDLMMATMAGVDTLMLTHYEPKMSDMYYDGLFERAKTAAVEIAGKLGKRAVNVEMAREGEWHRL